MLMLMLVPLLWVLAFGQKNSAAATISATSCHDACHVFGPLDGVADKLGDKSAAGPRSAGMRESAWMGMRNGSLLLDSLANRRRMQGRAIASMHMSIDMDMGNGHGHGYRHRHEHRHVQEHGSIGREPNDCESAATDQGPG
ncbi:uncharacterized protein BJ171DRAFT_504732 [Polychytrium aggregatum]|uniref:uncharacterized protein n=1 Tax=Polychytrium aggregatum TaxID=110093 RepID=UPI0022FEE282|nr:uncharacterized protein BJ171DRAFT_504732 [Polychytrium aggregatum]KAI9204577.1 hypothetical protein BJ171DRAFT_504732 [Polychytrium aggregatum]